HRAAAADRAHAGHIGRQRAARGRATRRMARRGVGSRVQARQTRRRQSRWTRADHRRAHERSAGGRLPRARAAPTQPHQARRAHARSVFVISLAGRDILHAWGKFMFTGVGLGLLIGVTLTMAGVYRGMVDDARVLLDNSGADLWVVQRETLGPYAESSSLNDDVWRSIRGMPGVTRAANVTYLTMQVRQGERDVRAMVVGVAPGGPGEPGQPGFLVAGRHITRSHYEAVADVSTGFRIGDRLRIRRN